LSNVLNLKHFSLLREEKQNSLLTEGQPSLLREEKQNSLLTEGQPQFCGNVQYV